MTGQGAGSGGARTLVLGIDGGTFDLLDPLMRAGVMPGLHGLVTAGTRAPLRSTSHWLTPPAWTTAFTGRSPGNHGVFDFFRAEDRPGGMYFTLTDARDVACETVWSMASRHGRSVLALNFPVMFPPQPVDGVVVPGFAPPRHLRRYTLPREAYDELARLPGFDLQDLAMDIDRERKTVQGVDPGAALAWVQAHRAREAQWSRILQHFLITRPWHLAGINFDGNDKLLHLFWRLLDPVHAEVREPWEQQVRESCLAYFRELDGYLVSAVQAAGEGARTFLVSDHGFGPSHEIFAVNAWLARRGLLTWRQGVAPGSSEALTVDRLKSYVEMVDWTATTAYVLSPSSNGITLRVARQPGDVGITPEDYPAVRARLADELRQVVSPVDHGQVVVGVRTREEAFPGARCAGAPDLQLTLRDGGFVSILNDELDVRPRTEVVGTHREDGILVASGPGVRAGAVLERQSILDLAPTLLVSAGLPVPLDLEGRAVTDLFVEQALATPAPSATCTPHPEAPQQRHPERVYTDEEESDIVRRLGALGYL